MTIKNIKDKVLHELVEKTNPYLGGIRRKLWSIDPDFTIISNNCWAGSVYRYLNLPYFSPTCGLYFWAEDYIRFLKNIRYYFSIMPDVIPTRDSKHYERLVELGQTHVPIGILDDIEIVFLHYPTFQEAKEKWTRRASRINWNNLIVKDSEMNGCTEEMVREFDRLPFERKFIFTTRDYGVESQIIFKEYFGQEQVKDDTTLFNKYVNVKNLVMGKPFHK